MTFELDENDTKLLREILTAEIELREAEIKQIEIGAEPYDYWTHENYTIASYLLDLIDTTEEEMNKAEVE